MKINIIKVLKYLNNDFLRHYFTLKHTQLHTYKHFLHSLLQMFWFMPLDCLKNLFRYHVLVIFL